MPQKKKPTLLSKWIPLLLGVGAFLFFIFTRSDVIRPGESASILSIVLGRYYLPMTLHPLYRIIASLLVSFSSSPFLALSICSSFFAAILLLLLFYLTSSIPFYASKDAKEFRFPLDSSRFIMGIVSCLLLMVSLPFWLSATEPQNNIFDLLILAICFSLLLYFFKSSNNRIWFFAATFLYGIGITESPLFIGIVPVFGVLLLFVLLRKGVLSGGTLLAVMLSGFAGLLFYLIPVFSVMRLPDTGYGEFSGFWSILIDLWRKQYVLLKSGFPKIGGLLLGLITIVPWCYLVFIPKLSRSNKWLVNVLTTLIFLILNIIGAILLLEYTFSPRLITGRNGLLPYVIIASWMGYLAGYWWLRFKMSDGRYFSKALRPLWLVVVIANFLLPLGVGIANYIRFEPSKASDFTLFCKNIIESSKGTDFLFVQGDEFKSTLACLSEEESGPEYIFSINDFKNPTMRHFIALEFPELQLSPSNNLSVAQIMQVIVNNNAGGPEACGLMVPDLALSLGFQPKPVGLVSLPQSNIQSLDPKSFYNDNVSLFEQFKPHITSLRSRTNELNTLAFLRSYSKAANDIGVTLRLIKSDALAEQAFDLALEILPQNPSALLNLRTLVAEKEKQTEEPQEQARLRAEADDLLKRAYAASENLGQIYRNPTVLAHMFGYIYSEYYGIMLARQSQLAGISSLEDSAIEQAQLINPDNPDVQVTVALSAFGKGQLNAAAQQYTEILKQNPERVDARIGLAATAYSRRDINRAIAILEEYNPTLDDIDILSFRSLLYLDAGRKEEAVELFETALETSEQTALSASFLAQTAFRMADMELANEMAQKALSLSPYNLPMLELLINVAQYQKNDEGLVQLLSVLIRNDPTNIDALERMVMALMRLEQKSKASDHAARLLKLDESNVIGNLAMSSIMTLPEAREPYLRSAVIRTNAPLYYIVANNLAYTLVEQKRYNDALPYAEQSIEANPSYDKSRHTYAEALLGTDLLEKAEQQAQMSITLAPDDPNHVLLMAEIKLAQGQNKEADRLANKALPKLKGQWRLRAQKLLKKIATTKP